jgi:hypothetical protein
MHGQFEKPRKNDHDFHEDGGFKYLLASVAVVFVLLAVALIHPKSSSWISQAVEAEYGGVDSPKQPDAPAPVRTVRAQ